MSMLALHNPLNFEESPQPPDLEDVFTNNDTNDKQVPPFDPAVGALGCVSVGALSNNDVRLLVLD